MPFGFGSRKPEPTPPPEEWLPQSIGRRSFRSIPDPVIEPLWGGVRVLARFSRPAAGAEPGGGVVFIDEEGLDATSDFPEQAAAIAEAAQADELVLDGYLTVEATQATAGRGEPVTMTPPRSQVVGRMFTGGRYRIPDPDRRLDPERPIAFVAVDLLSIDGTALVDLPLIERKRLLDGALNQGEVVRVTPYTRAPVGSFASTWYGLGFREIVYKAANGRYRPGRAADDWAALPIRSR